MPQTKIVLGHRIPRFCMCLFVWHSLSHSFAHSLTVFLDVFSWEANNVATWHSRKCLIHARVRTFSANTFRHFQWNVRVNNINTKLAQHTQQCRLWVWVYFACVYGMFRCACIIYLIQFIWFRYLGRRSNSFTLPIPFSFGGRKRYASDIYCTAVRLHSIIQRIHIGWCCCSMYSNRFEFGSWKPQTQ